MKVNHILFLALMGVLAACSNNNSGTAANNDSVATGSSAKAIVAVDIKNDTTQSVYNNYIKLKNALVQSDVPSAAAAGNDLNIALTDINGCEHASSLARQISESKDIKQQRKNFILLNADLMGVIKNAHVSSGNIYMMYCPMANEGKGAYWFSSTKDIKNPYYGKEMLTCGVVKEEIRQR